MTTPMHQSVRAARDGNNPTRIARLPSGWVLLGDSQYLRGYCLLVADPVVPDLHALDRAARLQFLSDMALLGEALHRITDAARINYEILGNSVAALHAHVFPRYPDEPAELRQRPVWFYSDEARAAARFDRERDRPLMERIAREMADLGGELLAGL